MNTNEIDGLIEFLEEIKENKGNLKVMVFSELTKDYVELTHEEIDYNGHTVWLG